MACDSMRRTPQQEEERKSSLEELEKDIVAGKAKITRNAAGELSIDKWRDTRASKAGWCDGCALTAISNKGSWVAKRMLKEQGNVVAGKAFNTVGHGHPHGGKKR